MASAVPVFPAYDLERQCRVLQAVADSSSVPVPPVRWLETDEGSLGSTFFVMERVDGLVPPDLLPYNFASWLTEATTRQRSRLQDATVGVLAAVHSIPNPTSIFSFLDTSPSGSPLGHHVDDQWSYYEWVASGTSQPLLERTFRVAPRSLARTRRSDPAELG